MTSPTNSLIDPIDKRRADTYEIEERLPEEKPNRLHLNWLLARCPVLGFMHVPGVRTLIAKEDLETIVGP